MILENIQSFISNINSLLWSYILIGALIVLGLYFTIKCDFVQFKYFKDMFKLLVENKKSSCECSQGNTKKGISSFQAFCISTASRVGTGNLAGVAIAISLGGPGAVFWMWLIALIGAASSFVESTLAQVYKVKTKTGYIGGPAYYMEKGLNKRWMGIIFSILITLSFGLIFNSVQSNTISYAFQTAFGFNRLIVGAVLTVVAAIIVFGGVKRIASVCEFLVPIMAVIYILVSIFVLIKNFTVIPSILKLIIENAFGLKEAVGGGIGITIMQGIKRGLFSNEAGMGSAPNAAAAAEVSHPVKQGLIQTLGVFTDTLIICSCTAFIILLSGVYTSKELTGIQLTQAALSNQVGSWGNVFIAVCILLFAFSSIIGNYYYGESNIKFIKSSPVFLFIYRLSVIIMIFIGSLLKIGLVWDMADLFMGLMAIINLIAIFKLSSICVSVLKNYAKQKNNNIDPTFNKDDIEDSNNITCWVDVKNK